MGMEVLGIVLRLEEVFDLEIPDEEVEKWQTVGDTYLYLLESLGLDLYDAPKQEADTWTPKSLWPVLQQVIVEELRVDADRVTLTTHYVDELGVG
jgi:acyl carrier protein